ncbi:MAG: ADP-ribosylglycohydrolase family protein [Planctomycetes bacterium]|nr:ADP-ribosylglycohydrolase family protein [Planctomycetota bacterium]
MASALLHAAKQVRRQEAMEGALLGMAVGDAIGLPWEGLNARRGCRLFGTGDLRHRFFFGRGMISDDTEHAAMTAQALLDSGGDVERFQRSLAWRLRFWLLSLPAGVGLGTLRAILKLWLGFPPTRSGVNSAGNGPAMRAPIIGIIFADDPDTMRTILRASTRMTHRDPRAEQGAIAVATAAGLAAKHGLSGLNMGNILQQIGEQISDSELLGFLDKVADHLERGSSPEELAAAIGLAGRVTGYIHHTTAVALFCWLRFPGDFRQSVEAAVRLGGDTDTVAGIVGSLAGATTGSSAIPTDWLDGLMEWPRSVAWFSRLGARVAQRFPCDRAGEHVPPQPLFWPGQLVRNVFFLAIVLIHGFRRLLPPY